MKTTLFAVMVLLASIVRTLASQTNASSNDKSPITVDDSRPMAAVVWALEKRHGVIITYEDPPYHGSQLSDVTNTAVRNPARAKVRVLIPRGGPFTFEYPTNIASPRASMRGILSSAINQYHSTGYPTSFRLVQSGDVFHVVPSSFRNTNGIDARYTPLLDTKITLKSAGEWSLYQALNEIQAAVTRATGVDVQLASGPVNFAEKARVTVEASNEAARSVLLRTLASTGARLSWRLLYDPAPPGTYMMNIHGVATPEQH